MQFKVKGEAWIREDLRARGLFVMMIFCRTQHSSSLRREQYSKLQLVADFGRTSEKMVINFGSVTASLDARRCA